MKIIIPDGNKTSCAAGDKKKLFPFIFVHSISQESKILGNLKIYNFQVIGEAEGLLKLKPAKNKVIAFAAERN